MTFDLDNVVLRGIDVRVRRVGHGYYCLTRSTCLQIPPGQAWVFLRCNRPQTVRDLVVGLVESQGLGVADAIEQVCGLLRAGLLMEI